MLIFGGVIHEPKYFHKPGLHHRHHLDCDFSCQPTKHLMGRKTPKKQFNTPQKNDISYENQWLENVFCYWNSSFLGDMLFFVGV